MGLNINDVFQYGSRFVPPKIRGAAIVVGAVALTKFAKVTWSSGMKFAFKEAGSAGLTVLKSLQNAKYAKALNVIGVLDLVGDFAVTSPIDGTVIGFIPGSGLLQLGVATVNFVTKKNYMNTQFAWVSVGVV